MGYDSGAGAGCNNGVLGLVQDGRIAAVSFLQKDDTYRLLLPLSQSLAKLLEPTACENVDQSIVLDRSGRAYILVDNTQGPGGASVNRLRILASARDGTMQAFARLIWKVRNTVVAPK